MQLERGNMWSVFFNTDIFMITTNPIIKKDGSVVMGRGIALEAKTRYPTLPYDFGKALKTCFVDYGQCYVGCIDKYEETPICYFMVKSHWAERADLDIIKQSVFCLKNSPMINCNRIDLNFPGIGNGGLPREQVLPLLVDLPDNVHIWEYA